jgi:hypothetical protein
MFKVEITGKSEVRTVNTAKGPLQFVECEAFAHLPNMQYPILIRITMPKDAKEPYPKGMYQLAPESFYVGKFNRLELSPRLVPFTGEVRRAA